MVEMVLPPPPSQKCYLGIGPLSGKYKFLRNNLDQIMNEHDIHSMACQSVILPKPIPNPLPALESSNHFYSFEKARSLLP